jgi:hypothetical protein
MRKLLSLLLVVCGLSFALSGCSGDTVGSGPEAQKGQNVRDEYNKKNNIGTE